MTDKKTTLRKEINTWQLWALAVGMVISGEYFGWNYGWQSSGTVGFLCATLIVTVFYITFIFSYTELAVAMPDAGGVFTFAYKAFGKIGALLAGYAVLVDFLLAPPVIAFALGSYAHFLHPSIPEIPTAIAMYVVFIAVNLLGIKEGARFSLIITVLSVGELILYLLLITPHFEMQHFLAHNPKNIGFAAVFSGIPYAIWFYIAIEGVAMLAEEVKNPQKTIPKAYFLAIITLVILVFGIMVLSGGVGDWRKLQAINDLMPQTLTMALGEQNGWSKLFASLGLFGLIASFHGNTIACSRQIFAMAREGFLPRILSKVNIRFQTPHWALLAVGLVGLTALFSGKTEQLIVLSALGALVMYAVSLAALFVLRAKQPDRKLPFKTPFYPFLPLLSLLLCLVCLGAVMYYNPELTLIFLAIMVVFVGIGWFYKGRLKDL
ncbi:MAG: ethanolamine permease [Verrucomicrobia bacterium]|nr:ethanolamine permease [Cytophagales bacterium]